jgi:hypothetical protein
MIGSAIELQALLAPEIKYEVHKLFEVIVH